MKICNKKKFTIFDFPESSKGGRTIHVYYLEKDNRIPPGNSSDGPAKPPDPLVKPQSNPFFTSFTRNL